MRLYHIRECTGKRCWGLFEPQVVQHEDAKVVVMASVVNFSEHMATWIMQAAPILKAAGYSPEQIGQMLEHAYFSKYQVVGFDSESGLADVIVRHRSAFTSPEPAPPKLVTGKVIVFATVIAVVIIWYLFSTHEETATISPPLDLYLVTYEEYCWYTVIIAHTPGDKYHYELAHWPGFFMSSRIPKMEAREGTYDRLVFLGTHFEKVFGRLFWHWYNWDFWDVDFVGFLTRKSETLFMLQEGYEDRFAPEKPWFSTGPERFEPLTDWWQHMTKFW